MDDTDKAEVNVLYHKIEKLDNDLKKREGHLSQLIDEVVYAEENRDKAVRRAEAACYLVDQLESAVQDLLGYLKLIEGNVLLPAFLDLSSVVPQDPVVNRNLINQTLEKIPEDTLTSRTKKLIASAREIPSETQSRAAREVFMRNVTEESVSVEDAIVLSGMLLGKKNELTALLDDVRDRVQHILRGNRLESFMAEGGSRSVSAQRNANFELEEIQEQMRRVEKERNELQRQLLKSESTVEISRVFQEDKNEMMQQLLDVHQKLLKEQSKVRELKTRVETLEQSVEQLEYEKELLQKEVNELKRQQVNWNRSQLDQRGSEEVQDLRAELERVISEHSRTRAVMESQMADIRAQNSILLSEKQEQRSVGDERDYQIATLLKNNERLKCELFEIQQNMLSSSSVIQGNRNSEDVQKLRAEVTHMAEELDAAERRMAEFSSRFQDERNQIVADFEAERKHFKSERQECDALVERMANELEQLALDNRALRASATLRQL